MQTKRLDNFKTLMVDVDDTLAMGDLSSYPNHTPLTLSYINGPVQVIKNEKNVNLMIYFYKLGYNVIVWSRTGSDWAELVCKSFGIDKYVHLYLTKPLFYLDDKECQEWMGDRRWRDCK